MSKKILNLESMILGKDLRKMRRDAGLTTVQMAHTAGCKTRKTYENWEKNIGTPNVNQFLAMCQACGYNTEPVVVWSKLPVNIANNKVFRANIDVNYLAKNHF